MNNLPMNGELIEKDGELCLSGKGVVMLISNTAYHEFANPHAMRKSRVFLNDILTLAKQHGYRDQQHFRATFAKKEADAEKVEQVRALFEYVDGWDVFNIMGMGNKKNA